GSLGPLPSQTAEKTWRSSGNGDGSVAVRTSQGSSPNASSRGPKSSPARSVADVRSTRSHSVSRLWRSTAPTCTGRRFKRGDPRGVEIAGDPRRRSARRQDPFQIQGERGRVGQDGRDRGFGGLDPLRDPTAPAPPEGALYSPERSRASVGATGEPQEIPHAQGHAELLAGDALHVVRLVQHERARLGDERGAKPRVREKERVIQEHDVGAERLTARPLGET